MSFYRTQMLLVIFFTMFFILFHSSKQNQYLYDFYIFDSSSVRYSYFSITRNKKLQQGKIHSVQVYDDMACIQQCLRVADHGCVSVNFKKKPTNELHQCELLAIYGTSVDMKDDMDYDHITVQNASFSNCAQIYKTSEKTSGVYRLRTSPSRSFQVYCDMVTSGGGWTVIQKRQDGSVDFYRVWDDYKKGFGNKLGEYWLGLDTIHNMTSQGSYRLRVDMEDFEGETRYAEYDSFFVADEADNYRLSIGGYVGDAGDSLIGHNALQFTTRDRDNDVSGSLNCAVKFTGAWWYKECHASNLNGRYLNGATNIHAAGVVWYHWKGHYYSLKRVEMKIRPKEF